MVGSPVNLDIKKSLGWFIHSVTGTTTLLQGLGAPGLQYTHTLLCGLLTMPSVCSHSTRVFFQVRCGILRIFFFLLEGRRTSG
eukprot:scaffold60069_cov103-Phaeocystis_antarctica.AAC.1